MVTVRRATPADQDALTDFLKAAYPTRWQYKYPERWQWAYVDNPFLMDDQPPVFIAVEEDGRVVGQTCSLVEPLKLGDQVVRVGWSVDTFLFKEYRGQGIGFELQKINDEANPIFMSLSMSKQNRKIKAGLGSIPLDPAISYRRLAAYTPESLRAVAAQRWGKFPAGLMRVTLADRLAAAILNFSLFSRQRNTLRPADRSIVFQMVDSFGEEMDGLWEKLSPCFHAAVPRTAEYMNWKYIRQPFVKYTRLIARRGDEVVGYLVLRVGQPPERKVGILTDFLIHPEDEAGIQTLIAQAARILIAAGVKDISAATTIPAYQGAFEKLGFEREKEVTPMFHCKLDEETCRLAVEPGGWLLGKGDHDWDQYPLSS